MARQYVRSIVGSVQRVVNAISPSRLSSQPKSLPGSPKVHASRASPVFTFANQAGLDMLEITLVAHLHLCSMCYFFCVSAEANQEKIVEVGGLTSLLLLLKSSEDEMIRRVAAGAIANLAMNGEYLMTWGLRSLFHALIPILVVGLVGIHRHISSRSCDGAMIHWPEDAVPAVVALEMAGYDYY
ncbi:hypothetical protein IFM89_039074 [Coptis chinensis]|uniref:MEKHLA domain-containing protein n=1 Tax=Coptis chinensis TaxID=261450 RepID=A0A835M6D2_9MAGN|nr:hypothetical protein IFM89_039074 [Coptis chinensis]